MSSEVQKGELIYEGKAKKVYATNDPGLYWVEYKDSATAFNGEKKATISGKGELNNQITAIFFELLKEKGIESHFVQLLSPNEQLVKKLQMIQLEVVVRNVSAGSLAKRLGWAEGENLPYPVVELYYKNDELGDPLLNDFHVRALQLATEDEMQHILATAMRINLILMDYLKARNIKLVDFKLEFGRTADGRIMLGDEISPDNCRFWDAHTGQKLDKDLFRRDLGDLVEAYQEIFRRLGGEKHV